jgi:hypothetical protein
MSRAWFGGTSADWLVSSYPFGSRTLLALQTGQTVLNLYSAATGGTPYTDLLDATGTPITSVTVTGHQVPPFQGPDAILGLWADKGDGSPRELLEAQDTAAVASAVASATAAAATATATLPTGTPAAYKVPWRDASNVYTWTAATAVVARALGWKIADDYALDTTGATTHTAAQVQAWLDDAAAGTAYASGTIKCSGTAVIKGDSELSHLTWNYTGSTLAIQVGVGTSGTLLLEKTVRLPRVICTGKPTTGWTAGTIGVQAINTDACVIWVPKIQGFETGYYAWALGTGNVYNEVHLLHLDNNKRNMVAGAGTGGWSNSNNYYLGLLTHNSAEGSSVAGARCILHESATNLVNANHYYGGSVEGNVAEFHLEENGLYNIYDGLRWENSGGCRVEWGATSSRNDIRGGYTAQSIVETHVAGSSLNRISSTGMSRVIGSTAKAVQWLENTSSSTAGVNAIMDPGATLAGSDPTVAYRVFQSADETRMKRATDTNDRLKLDHVNGRVYLGNAAAAIAMYLTAVSTSGVSLNGGNLYSGTDNTYDIGLVSSLRFRDLFLGRNAAIGGTLAVTGNVGFNGTAPAAKPTVTGSRGGNAALASLLTALAGLGLITDSSTA